MKSKVKQKLYIFIMVGIKYISLLNDRNNKKLNNKGK